MINIFRFNFFSKSYFTIVFFALFCGSTFSKNIEIYISPEGVDSADGSRADLAVKSLDRVRSIFESSDNIGSSDIVDVIFMPGKYRGLSVVWDVFKAGVSINFRPYKNGDKVIIDGGGSSGKFFVFRLNKEIVNAGLLETNISFKRIHLMNYCEGISFGDWKSDVAVTNNKIEGVIFQNIGSKYDPVRVVVGGVVIPNGSCVAAVRLQNSRKNILLKNKFINIENLPQRQTKAGKYGPLLMHSIYLSDDASDNIIRENQFRNFTGSPIRIRNRSDRTRVVDNKFEQPIYAYISNSGYVMKAVSQWYCNQEVKECIDRDSECPSLGTILSGNSIEKKLELYSDESQSKNSTCPVGELKLRNTKDAKEIEFQ